MVNCSNSPKLVYLWLVGKPSFFGSHHWINTRPMSPKLSFSQVQKSRKQMVLEYCLWMFVAMSKWIELSDVIVVLYIYIIPTFGVCNHSYTHLGFDRILFKWALLAKFILAVDQFRHSRAKNISPICSANTSSWLTRGHLEQCFAGKVNCLLIFHLQKYSPFGVIRRYSRKMQL